MKRLFIAVCLLAAPLIQAGELTRQVEDLSVNSVRVFGPVEVEINQGKPTLLLIRGDEELLNQQPFFVQGSTLVLGRNRRDNLQDEGLSALKFKLTVPDLESLQLAGSGEMYVQPIAVTDLSVELEGPGAIRFFAVTGNSMTIKAAGSGDIQLADLNLQLLSIVRAGSGDTQLGKVTAGSLEASLNGSGDISVGEPASTTTLRLNIIGSGDMDFSKVDAGSVEVNIMGSGDANVGNSMELTANIMGSGDIYYRGEPDIDKSVLGSGDVVGQ